VTDAGDAEALAEVQRRSYTSATASLRAGWPERQALDADGLAALLGRHRYGVLATGRADGRPHAAPVAFTVARGAFWIGTVAGLRLRNLRATPWAALVVMEGQRDEDEPDEAGAPHVALTVEGPVSVYEGEAMAAALVPLAKRWVERHGHPPDWAEALLELRPQRLFSHDAGRSA
jgi:nitroimidazol reductase NimA-like FMN-containing flavoprotein (pyridoxamine 5'-phosphate oxidase superfamily)